jgi:hypothetical protein
MEVNYETREFVGTVQVENGVMVISGQKDQRNGLGVAAEATARGSQDGHAEFAGVVAFLTKWKDGGYDVFVYKDEDNDIVSVELKLKED